MIDKRSFMLGFIIGKLSTEELPTSWWISSMESYCKRLNMTPPNEDEKKELADFLEFVSRVLNN